MWACIVGDHEPTVSKIKQVLTIEGPEPPRIVPGDLIVEQLPSLRPKLVVCVLGADVDQSLMLLNEICLTADAHVVAVGPEADSRLVLRAMHAGANDYVTDSSLADELRDALARLASKSWMQGEPGRIIALLGPSGGSGSSTLAVNIATVLAKQHERAALFDLKLGAGDLAPLLDLKPEHSLAELCQNASRMDRVMFERCLSKHVSGVSLLSPPASLSDISFITSQGVRQALTLARALFPYVVVDLDHSFRDEQLQVLRQANVVLLVFRLDFTSLRNMRTTLDYLRQMGINQDRIRLVVNRYGQPKEVPAAKAEEALGLKIAYYIPDDAKTINRANNNGIPVVLESPSARVSRSVTELSISINGRHK